MTPLTVDIHSFSYKKGGIPKDLTDNGGGFVFDCRGILNPGRIEAYKQQTGADEAVRSYLKEKTRIHDFLTAVEHLIAINIEDYLDRGFQNLQINFGCTGGQHRSVYCAIHTADFIRKNYPQVTVQLSHDELPHLNHSVS